ncbi:hydroxypyruvate isomerase [Pandoraea terrae]|uniref:Hydroxypyruvate isomerase n=1 Tax=Pandoraea terrae TaxID=1537710 RepID=A0A5E4S9F2_9BURK|nr:2-oxo-tetronate isomerase [Pandoraea terrae]VVD70659.1 hydroxypyruvate isomerase [Pandoraea terrae]
MPRFAANLTMMYSEHAFLDRFAAAARDGFRAVEYLFPYEYPAAEIARRLRESGLTQALFNLPPGDWAAGERGIAALPGRETEFEDSLALALHYATATDCHRLHAMAGLVPVDADRTAAHETYVSNLRFAARRCAQRAITLLIEPINTRDMPGYFLNTQQQAHDIVLAVGEPNLKVQMDAYHCQIMEGDITMRLRKHFAGVGHVQIAGVPDRHEPDDNELNYAFLFAQLDALGYDGYVGCEYRPRAGTSDGLAWFQPWKEAQR